MDAKVQRGLAALAEILCDELSVAEDSVLGETPAGPTSRGGRGRVPSLLAVWRDAPSPALAGAQGESAR